MKRCRIDEDPIKGRGVYAEELIRKGEVIEVCELLFIPSDNDTLEGYVFGFDKKTNVVALGNGSLYNHGKNPNAMCYFDDDGKRLVFEATKKIHPGEEILINYGYSKEFIKKFNIKT